ncbi:MAG: hydroxymethylbilane synthase [Candidatus Levyibacteriota bacterium]
MDQSNIIIGTRGSQMALNQANRIKNLLQPLVPNREIIIKIIATKGDKNMKPIPLDTIGKGWFSKEIDKQLLDGTIDIGVHSLKDLLDIMTNGLAIVAIPKRDDPREALVARDGLSLQQLKKGAIIGTDSLRRKIQILKLRPDLVVKSVRGNVNRRIEKLDAGEYDGLFLAVSGLQRLDLEDRITQYFDAKEFIPSPGQGALAVVSKTSQKKLNAILSELNHNTSVIAVTAERTFSAATGGGCSMPVGAYAEIQGKTLTLYGMIGSEDGRNMITDSLKGTVDDPKGLAQKLAEKLLQEAGDWYKLKKII